MRRLDAQRSSKEEDMYGEGFDDIGPRYISKRIVQRGFGANPSNIYVGGGVPSSILVVSGGGLGNLLSKTFAYIYPYLQAFTTDMKEQAIKSGKKQIGKIGRKVLKKMDDLSGSGRKKMRKNSKKRTKRKRNKVRQIIRLKNVGEFPSVLQKKKRSKKKVNKIGKNQLF